MTPGWREQDVSSGRGISVPPKVPRKEDRVEWKGVQASRRVQLSPMYSTSSNCSASVRVPPNPHHPVVPRRCQVMACGAEINCSNYFVDIVEGTLRRRSASVPYTDAVIIRARCNPSAVRRDGKRADGILWNEQRK